MGALLHTACPWCGMEGDEHDGRAPDSVPQPGDVSFCAGCLGPGIFIAAPLGLMIRKANRAEQAAMMRKPELRQALEHLAAHLGRPVSEAIDAWRRDG